MTKKLEADFRKCWYSMKMRCENPEQTSYWGYGSAGITVCDEWQDYEKFKYDMFDYYKNHRAIHKTTLIDRKDNSLGYSKANCRWVTAKKSAENRRTTHWITYEGVKLTMTDWARRKGMHVTTLSSRLEKGWSIEKALNTPLQIQK